MSFGVYAILYIIITNPTYSTGSHNVIIVLVKFLLRSVFTMDMLDEIEAVRSASEYSLMMMMMMINYLWLCRKLQLPTTRLLT